MTSLRTVPALCPRCGREPSEEYARGPDFEYATSGDFEWTFRRCPTCEIVCLSPRPADEEIPKIYPGNYYAYDFTDTPTIGYRAKTLLDRLSARSYQRAGAPDGNILDVGCGDGRLLQIFADRGVPADRLYGMELDARAVERARSRGFHVEQARFEEVPYPAGSFGLIVLQQVIEHVPDPRSVIAKLRELLRPGGAAVLETPNIASWDHSLFRRRHWGGYHIPRHFYLFNHRSLPALLREMGFQVPKVVSLASPNFWIQSVHHASVEARLPAFWTRLFTPHPPRFLPLALFSTVDAFGKLLGTTSNMRVIAVKR